MTVHGNSQVHTAVTLDGLAVHTNLLDGATQNYIDNLLIEEATYKTSGVGADSARGGVNLNIIPKDGGNTFRGAGLLRRQQRRLAERQRHPRPRSARPA